ncbi:alpha/beta hydrolase family protein [Bradyrhizobium sp. 2TAF24]|uniref:alpha/beta hydrolase family protein n=1 Tax=Bradyrhizobium sp. 2TAF24 TaxID=3233011 RepID=UPI003F8DAC8C
MLLSPDTSHHFELLRIIGHSYYGGADVQECLQVASALTPGDDESWYREWHQLAERVQAAGDASLVRGHHRSASKAYLRAATYHFAADFYLHGNPDDPRILASSRASRQSFMAASRGLDVEIDRVEIPFEGTTLPAYVMKRPGLVGRRPTLVCHSGFDGTKEEIAIWPGMAAAERGYVVLVFEGPGQGEVVREQRLTFRADWHNVVSPVIDYAVGRDDVDAAKIALMGISLGGLLAPLAAAHEHRLRALIANGGLYSFYEIVRGRYPAELPEKGVLEAGLREAAKTNTTLRWSVNHGRFVFGYSDLPDYLERLKAFEATNADQIRCATLVLDAELEGFFAGQPQKLYDRLSCPKTLMNFTIEEAAGAHCQAGAEGVGAQKIFDWLDETMQVT